MSIAQNVLLWHTRVVCNVVHIIWVIAVRVRVIKRIIWFPSPLSTRTRNIQAHLTLIRSLIKVLGRVFFSLYYSPFFFLLQQMLDSSKKWKNTSSMRNDLCVSYEVTKVHTDTYRLSALSIRVLSPFEGTKLNLHLHFKLANIFKN